MIASLAFLALATPGIVFAQATERDDIQAIAPLVGEGLSAVARIDIAGLDVEGLFRDVIDALPTQPLAAIRPHAIQVSRDLRAAGGKTVWCIANADDLGQAGGPLSQSPLPGQSAEAQARQDHDVPFLLAIPVLPPADVAKLAAALAPWMVTEQHGNLLLAGNARLIARARARRASPRHDLEQALSAVDGFAVRGTLLLSSDVRKVIEQMLPELPPEVGSLPTAPLVRGISWISLGLRATPAVDGRLVVESPDEAAAGRLHATLSQIVSLALPRLPADLARSVTRFQTETTGSRLVLTLKMPLNFREFLETDLQATFQVAVESETRRRAMDQLKQIVLAMHTYADRHHSLPPAAKMDARGKPLLSWRVLILPFIDQQLYDRFHLDEPWDSPHNRQLISAMPDVYRWPGSKPSEDGRTVFQVPVGETTMFPPGKSLKLAEIKDGMSKTIVLVECDDARAVVWTKPDDWAFDPHQPFSGLGGHFQQVVLVALGDGSVRAVATSVDQATLRAHFTAAGGEVANLP